jgi:hypothetical protein
MKLFIKNITCRGLLIFLIVQTLNLSINSLDFYTPVNPAASTMNDDYVDSMVEYLVENLMGYPKDTFHDKAYADNYSKQQQNITHFDLKWIPKSLLISDISETVKEIENAIPKNEKAVNLYFKEVPAKPPQLLSV